MRKNSVLVSFLGVLAVAVALPSPVRAADPNPGVLPIGSTPYGMSYGQWAGAWWRWVYAIPADVNPLLDQTGEDAGIDQSGPVWFLAGTQGGTAERTVTVPIGKALFFPVMNMIWVNAPEFGDDPWSPEQEALARGILAWLVDTATNLSCEIDGKPVENLEDYRCQTPPGMDYMVTFPENNVFYGISPGPHGPCVDDGYYLMLAPLPAGQHTIHFKGEMTGWGLSLDVMYHLIVKK